MKTCFGLTLLLMLLLALDGAAMADGTGIFNDSGQSLGHSSTFAVALGDLDGDEDLDAFIANEDRQANKVWLNDGSAIFTDSGQALGGSYSFGVALGDVDSDGDLDAFVANGSRSGNGQANKLWLNDGHARFSDSQQSVGSANSYAVALADVDSDGDLDAFVTNWGANKVWLNDGSGIFSDSGQSLGDLLSPGVAMADLDGDGSKDAFVANWGASDKVWLNDGSGIFSDSGLSLAHSNSFRVALGDVEGDNDLDALIGTQGAANTLWLNDGLGSFSESSPSLGGEGGIAVALGDIDSDGDLDAFVGSGLVSDRPNSVWLGDDEGTFTDSGQQLGHSRSVSVTLGDLDRDGDLDAFVGNIVHSANKVWLNENQEAPIESASIPLQPGWNLISIPLQPESTAPADVFASIAGNYTAAWAYDGCDAGNPDKWESYDPSKPDFLNELTVIDETKGFWINMTAADTLEVNGTVPSSTQTPLCPNEPNLVGYPSLSARPVTEALASIDGQYSNLRTYALSTDSWQVFDPNRPAQLNNLNEMAPGVGYWLNANQASQWMLDN